LNFKGMLLLHMAQSMAQGGSAQFCTKPGLALVGDLGDEVSAVGCVGAAVVGHCFGKI
jgi:hypothetical protein